MKKKEEEKEKEEEKGTLVRAPLVPLASHVEVPLGPLLLPLMTMGKQINVFVTVAIKL